MAPHRPALADLDRLVLAGDALRAAGTVTEAARLAATTAVDLAGASGATVLVTHPSLDGPVVVGRAVGDERTIEVPTQGAVAAGIVVHGGRTGDPATDGVLAVLTQLAAAAFDRLSTIVPLERIDPLTGAGNRRQAVADIASLRADDAVLLVALDDGSPFEAVVALVAYLRTHTRPPGDSVTRTEDAEIQLVLRGLKAPASTVAQRILDGWRATGNEAGITIGCASHVATCSPMDTRDEAAAALATARELGGDLVLVAPPRL